MSALAVVAGSQALWFVSRASGLVLLVLASVVMALGVATRLGSAPRRWPRFVVAELHRTLALFLVAFLPLHVATAILDPYVSIGWSATVLPFLSGYRTLAIGWGTLAVDLLGAVLVTSLVRRAPGVPRLAGGALAGLPGVAGGVPPLPDRGHRPGHLVGGARGVAGPRRPWWRPRSLARLIAGARHRAPAGPSQGYARLTPPAPVSASRASG